MRCVREIYKADLRHKTKEKKSKEKRKRETPDITERKLRMQEMRQKE